MYVHKYIWICINTVKVYLNVFMYLHYIFLINFKIVNFILVFRMGIIEGFMLNVTIELKDNVATGSAL